MKEKIIVLTGVASGIGLATSKKLSRENIVIIADYKDVEEEFVKENFNNYKNVHFFKYDISKKEDILNLKEYV